MNKHFRDARYYLGRASEHAKEGIKEELEPIENRVREIVGLEEEEIVEPGRVEKIQTELKELEAKAEGEAKEAIATAREKIREYREREESEQTAA